MNNPLFQKSFKLYKQKFEKIDPISAGGYGNVFKVKIKDNPNYFALKQFKKQNISEGIGVSCIREISILKEMSHENIETIIDSFYSMDSLYILFEYYECHLRHLCKCKFNYNITHIKEIMHQLLSGLHYLHSNGILHRDIKNENILVSKEGVLKIADFGLARFIASPGRPMSQNVITINYKPPEILFGAKHYSYSVDMWTAGCILAFLLKKEILFQGESELDVLTQIFTILGVPNEKSWKNCEQLENFKYFKSGDIRSLSKEFSGCNKDAIDLLEGLLTLDPAKRLSAKEALEHSFFKNDPKRCGKEGLKKWVEYYITYGN